MTPRVTVSRAELAATLKLLAKFVRGKMRASDIVLRWCDGALELEAAGQVTALAATGTWPGQVRAPARVFLAIATRLPEGETLELWVEGGRLHLGPLSTACTWEAPGETEIDLPIDPPLTLILSLAHRFTPDEIVRAGKARLLQRAEERRDRMIRRAAAILRPLGVTPDDLVEAVDTAVRRLYGIDSAPER